MEINWLLTLLITIPLFGAIINFFAYSSRKVQCITTIIVSFLQVCTAVDLLYYIEHYHYLVNYVSHWPAPFGITLVADNLSALMVMLTAIIGLSVAIYSAGELQFNHLRTGFYPAYCILLTGLSGAFLTGDLFNLYVWVEVSIIASFILLASGMQKIQIDATIKYVFINLMATSLLLFGIALIYSITGTLNIADLARHYDTLPKNGVTLSILLLLIIAFSIKAGVFPLNFWLPASYHTPSFSSSAIFAGLLSKLGIYALIRLFTLMVPDGSWLHHVLLVAAWLTIVMGTLGAIAQNNLRRILSFSLIAHIGFMILMLSFDTAFALTALIFYLSQHVLVKSNLFLIAGIVQHLTGSNDLQDIQGLYKQRPYLSILFMINALALTGMPPLSGFWAKLAILLANLQIHAYFSAGLVLVFSLLGLVVMLGIWQRAFCRDEPAHLIKLTRTQNSLFYTPVILLSIIMLSISFYPSGWYHLSQHTSQQLLNKSGYIHAVLEGESDETTA